MSDPVRRPTKAYLDVEEAVRRSYREQSLGTASPLVEEIRQIFAGLDRRKVVGSDLLDVKFMLSQWRANTASYLADKVCESVEDEETVACLDSLSSLGVLLTPEDLTRILNRRRLLDHRDAEVRSAAATMFARCADPREMREMLVEHGFDDQAREMGPPLDTTIRPFHKSRYLEMDWVDQEEVDAYRFVSEGRHTVSLRGITLTSGDLLVADQNIASEGFLGGYTEPRSYAPHCGLFVVLHYQRRAIPAVVEIHRGGARAVPLNRWLSRDFNYYAEAYRLDAPRPADWFARLSETVISFLRETKVGYDFRGRDIPDTGQPPDARVTCSSLAQTLYIRSGIRKQDVDYPMSQVAPGAARNLANNFGIEGLTEFFSPTDAVRSRNFRFVGVMDNNRFATNFARELVVGQAEGSISRLFMTEALRPERIEHWKRRIWQVYIAFGKGHNVVSRCARRLTQTELASLPEDSRLGALFVCVKDKLAKTVDHVAESPLIQGLACAREPVLLSAAEADTASRAFVQETLRRDGIREWFEPW